MMQYYKSKLYLDGFHFLTYFFKWTRDLY